MNNNADLKRRRFNLKDFVDDLYRLVVIRPVMAWQAWRCAKAKAYLLTHDISYRSSYVGLEIVRRRRDLYDQGVSPTDSRIPDRWSIQEELPPMSWPHQDPFAS